MFFFKLGLLSCTFYVVLTILLEGVYWAVIRSGGVMWFYTGAHPYLRLGLFFGVIFGIIWLISFGAAWYIVYLDVRSKFPIPQIRT